MGGISWTWWPCQLERCAPEDVAIGHLDLVEAERGQRAGQDDHAGDDRRRPVGVEPGDLAALARAAARRAARACASSARQRQHGGPRRRRAVGAEVDARALGRGAGHRDRRRDAARARVAGPPRRARGRPSSAERAQLLRASGGSECRWRSEWRTTPTWVETWKRDLAALADHELGRAAADVDHEQRARRRRRARGGRAEEGQPRLLVAAQRAARRGRSARGRRRRTRAPLAASRTAEVITAVAALGAVLRDRRGVLARARRTRARCGASPSAPVASTPSPSRVTIERRSTSASGPSAPTSAISSRVEFVPMSTTATRVSWPGAASARRRARRAGCRPRSRSCGGASARSPSRRGARRAGSARRSSGWSAGSGSGSVTSSAAPAIARSCRARSSAAGSTIGPRAVLTSSAVGFMRASASASIRWRVSSRERAVERDEVRALEQLLERHAARARAVEDLHPEALGAARDRLADAPEADDPERRAGHLGAERAVGLERDPLALAHVALALGQPPREREQQREREVGGRVGQHVGRVADRDAARASRRRGRRCRCRPRSWRSRAARAPRRAAPRRRCR